MQFEFVFRMCNTWIKTSGIKLISWWMQILWIISLHRLLAHSSLLQKNWTISISALRVIMDLQLFYLRWVPFLYRRPLYSWSSVSILFYLWRFSLRCIHWSDRLTPICNHLFYPLSFSIKQSMFIYKQRHSIQVDTEVLDSHMINRKLCWIKMF